MKRDISRGNSLQGMSWKQKELGCCLTFLKNHMVKLEDSEEVMPMAALVAQVVPGV